MNLKEIINKETTTLVDVREPYEFAMEHAQGAINIPLSTWPRSLEQYRLLSQPIVVYCRSGARSAQVMRLLKDNGIAEVYDGGGLQEVLEMQKAKILA